MWVDEAGVAHTTSPSDPALVLGESAIQVLSSLRRRSRRAVQIEIDRQRESFFEELKSIDPADFGGPERLETLPERPLIGPVSTTQQLLQEIGTLSLDWRLDALECAQEVVDRRD